MSSMPVSAIDREFLRYFTQLDELQKKSLLALIRSFLKGKLNRVEDYTLELYNRELDEAMARVEAGSFTTLEDLEKEMQGW